MTSQAASNRSLKVPVANTSRLLLPDNHPSSTLSHLVLFLTNVRLLDLDLRNDWPDITAVTFSTKDSQQNQKKRISCVEWVLYRLFLLWDEEETRNKLSPFFPPLEPLQSINLRAALFRCLDQVKKKGVLGRDTVLRKTMLDECKGERLEEVLSVFSTAVVKKLVLGEQNHHGHPIAVQLSTEDFSYMGERDVLAAINLVYRGVMSKDLRKRELRAAQLEDFTKLLDLKDRQLVRREEKLKELRSARGDQECVTTEESGRLRAQLQKNWTGDNEWLQIILHGDARFEKLGILGKSYDEVWKNVTTGSITEADNATKRGLLDQLDARVKQQNHRLAKWQSFQKSLSEGKAAGKSPSRPSTTLHLRERGLDLNLGGHESLLINQVSLGTAEAPTLILSEEYSHLIAKLERDLDQAGSTANSRRQMRALEPESAESGDEIDDMKVSRQAVANSLSPSEVSMDDEDGWEATESDERSESGLTLTPQNGIKPFTRSKSYESTPPGSILEKDSQSKDPIEERKAANGVKRRQDGNSISTMPPPPKPVASEAVPTRTLDPDSEAMANEILSSVATTSPLPMKPKHRNAPNLAERTRMSMARLIRSDLDISDFSQEKPNAIPSSSKPTIRVSEDGDPYSDLISRTRQSMSGFAAAQKKAEADKRRSIKRAIKKERESGYFPPPFSADTEEDDGSEGWERVDRSGLIEGNVDADYESVFKSRPKIALSPAVSPNMSPTKWNQEDEQNEDIGEEIASLGRWGR